MIFIYGDILETVFSHNNLIIFLVLQWILKFLLQFQFEEESSLFMHHKLEIFANVEKVWRRQWHPTAVLLPGKFHGGRSLVGYSPWGRKELDMTEWLHFLSFCSCWENSVSKNTKKQKEKKKKKTPYRHLHLPNSRYDLYSSHGLDRWM